MKSATIDQASRYRVIRQLGAGGMGIVELVYDSLRDEAVARKRILDVSAEALLRFKREFRAIEGIRHPGLVALYELGQDEVGPYFTMERVEGTSLLRYCAPKSHTRGVLVHTEVAATEAVVSVDRQAPTHTAAPPASSLIAPASAHVSSRGVVQCDWSRVEAVLPQIVDALAFLHAHGIVHCDLKPSNVLVRGDGSVKVLDFGVIAEMRAPAGRREVAAGTLEYMAPERLRGEPATPAVDAYALGVLLFEMISGQRPFGGSSANVVNGHLHVDPPRLETVVEGASGAWGELCAGLLRKDPEKRTSIEDLGRQLRPLPPRAFAPTERGADLVGRDALKGVIHARVDRARGGEFDAIVLIGATGAGKTALAEWAGAVMKAAGGVVLRARASPSERVAFNGIDGAIDDLARFLFAHGSPDEPTMQEAQARAASVFPVLSPHGIVARKGTARSTAFDAVVELLSRASPVALLVDDAQWADADALALLDTIVTALPRAVTLIVTMRDDVEPTAATAWLRTRLGSSSLDVGPLDREAVRTIIQREARRLGGVRATEAQLEPRIDAAAGRPFLAELAGRSLAQPEVGAGSLESGIAGTVRARTEGARDALALLLAAGTWTPVGVLAELLGKSAGETTTSVLEELVAAGLVRRAAAADLGAVDVYHDVVRVKATLTLGDAALTHAHGLIVDRLRRDPTLPTYRLVHHLVGAARHDEAATLARIAARTAEEQRAYAVAAAMYDIALRTEPDDANALVSARARVLERIGAYAEAVGCWRDLARRAKCPEEATRAAFGEAQALLGSHDLEKGVAKLNELLVAQGEPPIDPIRLSSPWSAARFLVGPVWTERTPRREPSLADRERIDRDLHLAQFVAYFDPLAGIRLVQRTRDDAMRSGAYAEAACCDYVLAVMAEFGTAKAGPSGLAGRYRARGRRVGAAATVPYPEVEAAAALALGWGMVRQGRWHEAERALDEAIEHAVRSGHAGSYGHLFALLMRHELEVWRQNIAGAELHFRKFKTAASEAGSGTMRFQVRFVEMVFLIHHAAFDEAQRSIDEIAASWPAGIRTAQESLIQMARLMLDCTRGSDSAWERARVLMRSPFRPLETCYGSLCAALCALACVAALRKGDASASAREVRKLARIAMTGNSLGRAAGYRALAYLADHEGKPRRALELLEQSRAIAAELATPAEEAIAHYRLGERLEGAQGHELRERGLVLLRAHGWDVSVVSQSFL